MIYFLVWTLLGIAAVVKGYVFLALFGAFLCPFVVAWFAMKPPISLSTLWHAFRMLVIGYAALLVGWLLTVVFPSLGH